MRDAAGDAAMAAPAAAIPKSTAAFKHASQRASSSEKMRVWYTQSTIGGSIIMGAKYAIPANKPLTADRSLPIPGPFFLITCTKQSRVSRDVSQGSNIGSYN